MICILQPYANTGTEASGLGLLHFPHSSLNSCLTYGQYHSLLLGHVLLYCLGPKQVGSSRCNRGIAIFTMTFSHCFTEVTVLVCIHSSIQSTNVYWEVIMRQNPFYIYAEEIKVQGLYFQTAHIWMRWESKKTRKISEVTNMIELKQGGMIERNWVATLTWVVKDLSEKVISKQRPEWPRA